MPTDPPPSAAGRRQGTTPPAAAESGNDPARRSQRRTAVGGVAGAAGSGSLLTTLAMNLRDPWRTILVYLNPTLTALVAVIYPLLADWAALHLRRSRARREARDAVRGLQDFIAAQKQRLQDESLQLAVRRGIQKTIDKAELFLTDAHLKASLPDPH